MLFGYGNSLEAGDLWFFSTSSNLRGFKMVFVLHDCYYVFKLLILLSIEALDDRTMLVPLLFAIPSPRIS